MVEPIKIIADTPAGLRDLIFRPMTSDEMLDYTAEFQAAVEAGEHIARALAQAKAAPIEAGCAERITCIGTEENRAAQAIYRQALRIGKYIENRENLADLYPIREPTSGTLLIQLVVRVLQSQVPSEDERKN